jgi:drug/metabolite transporter (DMT)-like permease
MSASARLTARPPRRGSARSEDAPALAAALLAVLLWASAFVAIRYVDRRLAPGALALGRLLVGSLGLGVVVLIRRERLPGPRVLARIALCGLLWFGIYNVVLNEAELRVDAGTAALLVNTGPIMIAILAGALLEEGFPPRLFSGCLVAFGGAALIGTAVAGTGTQGGLGAVLCAIAALAYAGGVVAQKPTLRSASALSVTWLACTAGALCCLPYAPELATQIAHGRESTVGWVIYLGIAPTAIGFVSWAYALSRTTAGRMGSTTYLVPPLAVLLAWALLGEAPPVLALPGGLACLAGVAISRSGSARAANAKAAAAPAPGRYLAEHRSPGQAEADAG